LQVVLNTLTEHNFSDAFKHGRNAGNGSYAWKGEYLEGDGGQEAQSWFLTRWQHQSQKLCISVLSTLNSVIKH
jgi:hypothetical protein